MDRNTRTVRQLEQFFKAYCMMFKCMKVGVGKKQLPLQSFCKEKKTIKGTKRF